MNFKRVENVAFDSLTLPDIFYKFRTWSNPYHKKTIIDQEFYFAPARELSHHEYNLSTDYDSVTEEDLYHVFYRHALELHGITDPDKRRHYALINILTTEFTNPSWRSHVDNWFLNRLNNEYGIISLSKTKDNCTTWMNFGIGHTGFAVGLDPNLMFEDNTIICSAGDVDYYDLNDPPLLKAFCENDQERTNDMLLNMFSLPDKFSDEDEYRLNKNIMQTGRFLKVKTENIKEIILGHFMSDQHKDEILRDIKAHLPNVEIKQQILIEEPCKMEFETIN